MQAANPATRFVSLQYQCLWCIAFSCKDVSIAQSPSRILQKVESSSFVRHCLEKAPSLSNDCQCCMQDAMRACCKDVAEILLEVWVVLFVEAE